MDIRGFFANLIYILPAVAIALSVHEFAHAFVPISWVISLKSNVADLP